VEDLFDGGRHGRAKIGFVLLATEQTIEDDLFRLRPEGVGIHFTRAANPDSITVSALSAQVDDLARAAGTLLPDGSLDVICYACTSGSIVMGEERVMEELRRGCPQAKATTLVTGAVRALRSLGVKRVAIATPYLDEVNELEARFFEAAGFEVPVIRGLNLEKDSDMVRVRPEAIMEFALSVDHPAADGLFISCGALRSVEVVDELERRLGKPVVVSNQAMAWDTLRLAGIEDRFEGYGSLLRSI
jgi:maleate isomerase